MPDPEIAAITPIIAPATQLPFPMNVNAPEPATPPPDCYGFDVSNAHRRRATLPSLILSPTDAVALKAMWGSSADDTDAADEEDSEKALVGRKTGVADASGTIERRRSRSADALQQLVKGQNAADLRRRSAEIRHWRGSSAEHSASTQERTVAGADARADPPERTTHTGTAYTNTEVSTHRGQACIASPHPPQSEIGVSENIELAENSEPPVQGVYVEKSTKTLRTSAEKLDECDRWQTIAPEDAWKGRPSRQSSEQSDAPSYRNEPRPRSRRSSTSVTTQRARKTSSPSTADTSSPRTPTTLPCLPNTTAGPPTERTAVHTDTCQIKTPPNTTSHPSYNHVLSTLAPPSMYEQLVPLYNALRYERSARKALEVQVIQLHHDLFELNSFVRQMAGSNPYPTPSPERTFVAGSVERELEENARRQTSRFSRFDSEDEDGENGDEREQEGKALASPDPEGFLTPLEESRSYGFGPPLREARKGFMF